MHPRPLASPLLPLISTLLLHAQGSRKRRPVLITMSAEHAAKGTHLVANQFDRLPDEILLAIFRWVATLEPCSLMMMVPAVCRRWRRLSGETLGVRLDFTFLADMDRPFAPPEDSTVEDRMVELLAGLARRFKHVVEIDLSHDYVLRAIETDRSGRPLLDPPFKLVTVTT